MSFNVTKYRRPLVSLGVVFSFLLTSCTEHAAIHNLDINDGLDGIYSTREQQETAFLTILRLKNQALLETAQRTEEGALDIDPTLLTDIELEQEETIEQLQKISSEIKIVYRYKSVLNGLAVYAPGKFYDQINSLPNVTFSEQSGRFHALEEEKEPEYVIMKVGKSKTTSVKFIGAEKAYGQNLFGQGMRVGIIDTGIDYTHRMFGGEGTVEAYKAIDPSAPTAAFPNNKVVGGIDLVGSEYSSGSPYSENRLPLPDANPIDESGHGTHVAGTVAGLGDGVNTYDGVAPAASLYAIKVFGKTGSTTDAVVIAGLEYAVDPSQDFTYKDQLDVVNLSLGGDYGNPHIMYSQAIKNVVKGGTIVVASAGNEGDHPYIVGAPSIADDSISVASSVDNQDQNISSPASDFTLPSGEVMKVEHVEGTITKPLEEVSSLEGELVDMGVADKDPVSPLKEQIQGRIALITRGGVSFSEKIRRAYENGAIGVVMHQNNFDKPISMGGGDSSEIFPIPAVMIDLENAMKIRREMGQGKVIANLKPAKDIDKSYLIDTISEFSSRGPRSEDGHIKPEISAPGHRIISAGFGMGTVGVSKNGTSMAAPHIAGVMALLKQKFPNLTPTELKSVLLSQAKTTDSEQNLIYPVARQGAGRVQIGESLKAKVVTTPSTLSFGITDVEKSKVISQMVTFKNISEEPVTLHPEWSGSAALKISSPVINLQPEEEITVTIKATISASKMFSENEDLDGYLTFKDGANVGVKLPALVVARQISNIQSQSLTVHATSAEDSAGSFTELVLENKSANGGPAYLFNLLGLDQRKANKKMDYSPNRNCDMQSAGYRILETESSRILQIAVKLYEGMTTWHTCEVNVQIDGDSDNVVDQEIAGLPASYLPGLTDDYFISLLLDGTKAKALRKQYEEALKTDPKAKEDYSSAVQDQRPMQVFDNSTLAIIQADISKLHLGKAGELSLKISTTHQDAGILEYDDYLGKQNQMWKKISVQPMAQGYAELPDEVYLNGQEVFSISLLKGYGNESLILYSPQNKSVRDNFLEDKQSQILEPQFRVDDEEDALQE